MAPKTPEVDAFAALANPVRREILTRLRRGPCRAGDLAERLSRRHGIGRPAVSEHLQVLRRARLVREEPRGRERFYHLDALPLRGVEEWVAVFSDFWNERLDALESFLDATEPPRKHKESR
jgi:DNA-binding transcriptional ArsR family regulator